MSTIRAWLEKLEPKDKLRLSLVAGVLLVAVVLLLTPQPDPINSSEQAAFEVTQPATRSDHATAKMLVHVSGEVVRQGLYELPIGARVADAIRLAGGFTQAAHPESVNLARILNDGEQIIVGSAAAGVESEFESLVSINSAALEELDELPGIGPALANRIVQWRVQFGGFKRLQDLLEVSGIGEKLLAQLIPLITL